MSEVLDTLRPLTGRQSALVDRIDGLRRAVVAGREVLPAELIGGAEAVLDRAAGRLRLSGDHTVVALAGATGSGKSSLFNALAGLDLAAVGVKRPTTSWAIACSWGPDGAGDLLDWLGIPRRHQVDRMGMLDESSSERAMEGLILLDLPDHDSTEVSHHLEVARLVELADVFCWILDPQKYADAAIHDRFLRPLAAHAGGMIIVLNHVDEIPADGVDPCLGDLRRLLDLDGLGNVALLATSAVRGDGMPELRSALIDRVIEKRHAVERLDRELRARARTIDDATGHAQPPDPSSTIHNLLVEGCSRAAGIAELADVQRAGTVDRGLRMTGHPLRSWIGRRHTTSDVLHYVAGEGVELDRETLEHARTIENVDPGPGQLTAGRVDAVVRTGTGVMTAGMGPAWASRLRAASTSRLDELTDRLAGLIGTTDLTRAGPAWWSVARLTQWILLVAFVGGAGWMVGVLIAPGGGWSGVASYGLPIPLLVALVALIGAVAIDLGGARLVRRSADLRSRRLIENFESRVGSAVDELVIAPIAPEIESYRRCRDGLEAALHP